MTASKQAMQGVEKPLKTKQSEALMQGTEGRVTGRWCNPSPYVQIVYSDGR